MAAKRPGEIMDSIGETLRRERLRRGLKLEQVAAQTKIGPHLLQAMEEDRFDRLPGGLFTRSFLRQYTHALDLNEDEIISSLKQQFEEPAVPLPEPPRRYRPSHLAQLPTLAWLLVALVASGAIYGLWQNVRRSLAETHAAAPLPAPHEGPAVLSPSASLGTPAKPIPEMRSVEEPVPVHPAASQPTLGAGAAAMRVVFAATEPVWLSIKSDGVSAYTGTLEGQQSREFDASSKMTVLVGNAAGLTISLNGNPVALAGAHGEVRSLVLTTTGVQVVPRTPPALPITPEDHSDYD